MYCVLISHTDYYVVVVLAGGGRVRRGNAGDIHICMSECVFVLLSLSVCLSVCTYLSSVVLDYSTLLCYCIIQIYQARQRHKTKSLDNLEALLHAHVTGVWSDTGVCNDTSSSSLCL